jgi:uncharacterized protein YcbK (DUF882 family)
MKSFTAFFVLALVFVTNSAFAASLQGSPAAMERQNKQADKEKLSRLHENQLEVFKKKKLLVPLPDGKHGVVVDPRHQEKYNWCRPWTRRFLVDLGKDFEKKFGRPIQVNSAVRSVEYQELLKSRNANAAKGKSGPKRSSHLTGATVDIAKKDMSTEELAWMRNHLLALEKEGLIEATEEHVQPVFHVAVYKHYKKIKKKTV